MNYKHTKDASENPFVRNEKSPIGYREKQQPEPETTPNKTYIFQKKSSLIVGYLFTLTLSFQKTLNYSYREHESVYLNRIFSIDNNLFIYLPNV